MSTCICTPWPSDAEFAALDAVPGLTFRSGIKPSRGAIDYATHMFLGYDSEGTFPGLFCKDDIENENLRLSFPDFLATVKKALHVEWTQEDI